ncbi:hypothetical protein [Lachnoclostridium sp. MSJ-17]|uniref:hypothetical protein n=1 Tax=Lachnoclostridium sp. MSJ-17 TaxID=2841516 RepID=UPI001C11843A|nr:hypothetical protein [Lachnoclostridium sp. MSJ-17]MBU5462451.1 hypothetical protein [Lachnoclostridium sp. MSJ-17]
MANSNLPKGWGSQNNSPIKPWATSNNNSRTVKPPFKSSNKEEQQKNNDVQPDIAYNDSFNTGISASEEEIISENQPQTTEKKHKTIRISTVILSIALTAVVCFLVVFIVLYFSGKGENTTNSISETTVEQTISATEGVTEKPTEVAITEAATAEPTTAPKPTTEPPTEKPKEEKQSSASFESYLTWLNVGVYVHEKPDPTSNVTYVIDTATNYTIVDESYDEYGDLWGKLKSGVGWVNLSLADMVTGYDTDTSFFNPKYHSDIKTKQVGNITFLYRSQANHADDNSYSENIDSLLITEINSTTYNVTIDGEIIGNVAGFSKNIRFVEMDSNFKYLGNNYPIAPDMPNRFHYEADLHIMNNDTSNVFILLEVF